jgi:hypothetical protein
MTDGLPNSPLTAPQTTKTKTQHRRQRAQAGVHGIRNFRTQNTNTNNQKKHKPHQPGSNGAHAAYEAADSFAQNGMVGNTNMTTHAAINTAIAGRPEEFLHKLSGETPHRTGENSWSVEYPSPHAIQLTDGTLVIRDCATGKIIDPVSLWARVHQCDNHAAMKAVAAWAGVNDAVTSGPSPTCAQTEGQFVESAGRVLTPLEAMMHDDNLMDYGDYLNRQPWDNDSANHNKAYCAMLFASSRGISKNYATKEIAKHIRAIGGTPDFRDLAEQWKRACSYVGKAATNGLQVTPKEPSLTFSPDALNYFALHANVHDPFDYVRRKSTVRPSSVSHSKFLDTVYRPGEKIIIFNKIMSQGQAIYTVGQSLPNSIPPAGPDGIWFLVQPVDGAYHIDPDSGKKTRRSMSAVTRLPYLVLESDRADLNHWMRLLIQLPLAIVAIYHSAGRSIHALVRVDAADKQDWDSMKRSIAKVLVPLGADPGALSAVRLSRLPGCWRGAYLQELLYLNPNADGTPIYSADQSQTHQ